MTKNESTIKLRRRKWVLFYVGFLAICGAVATDSYAEKLVQKPQPFAKSSLFKKNLGISELDMSSLDFYKVISDKGSITNTPLESCALIYKLYGVAGQYSDRREVHFFKYEEPLPDKELLDQSKEYLMAASVLHTNSSARSYAAITLAAGFPSDVELSNWAADRYFFSSPSPFDRKRSLFVIRLGSCATDAAVLCVKDGLRSRDPTVMLEAIRCIQENPGLYKGLLPDLILAAREFQETMSQYKKKVDYGQFYRCLLGALMSYGEEADAYRKHIQLVHRQCIDTISKHHFEEYIKKLSEGFATGSRIYRKE